MFLYIKIYNFYVMMFYIYVQEEDLSESEQDHVQADTSFGRSILHELDERSLFNKKVHKTISIHKYLQREIKTSNISLYVHYKSD